MGPQQAAHRAAAHAPGNLDGFRTRGDPPQEPRRQPPPCPRVALAEGQCSFPGTQKAHVRRGGERRVLSFGRSSLTEAADQESVTEAVMPRFRLTLGRLLFLIAIVAANFGAIRYLFETD